MKKLRKLVKVVREIDGSEKIKIGFSSVIYRKEKDLEDERNEVSMKLKKRSIVKVKVSFLLKMPTSMNQA